MRQLPRGAVRALPLAAAVGGAVAAAAAVRPPRPAGPGTPDTAPSAARAERHLVELAREPRPAGSAAAAKARDHIAAELAALGLDVEVQESVGVGEVGFAPYGPRYRGAGPVRNLVARLPGREPGPAVLAVTHYDSVGQGTGAADAAAPVAALLEAVRALVAGGQRRRDLVLLVSDGEEGGLLGGSAFFAEHPAAADVRAVLNFEARGTSGPPLMFEAGPGNGPMVAALARAGTPAFASSLFDEVYRRLPNATDFTHAKDRGLPGLNFANVAGFVGYHGPLDDVDHCDRGTLQHHAELAYGLLDRLCDADLTRLSGDDEVFFSVGHGRLVHYPARYAPVLAVVAVAAATATVRGVPAARLLRDTAGTLARLAGSAVAGSGLTWALGRRRPEFRRCGDFHDADLVYAGLTALLAAANLTGAPEAATRRLSGATVPLALGSALLAARLPGASYLPTWPLLGAAAGTALAHGRPAGRLAGAAAAATPAAALLAPLSRLAYQGLTPRLAGAATLVLQLLADLAQPAVRTAPAPLRRLLAAGAALGGAAALATAAARRPGPARPAPDTLSWLLDADTGTARWLSSDDRVTSWTVRALGERPERGPLPDLFPGWRREFLHAPAPALPLAAPTLDVLADEVTGRQRVLTLLVRSPRAARQVWLSVPGTPVTGWAVEGRTAVPSTEPEPRSARDAAWELWLHAVPAEGLRVRLVLDTTGPVAVRVADRDDGLPDPVRAPLLASGPVPADRCEAAALDVETWGNASLVTRLCPL